MVNMVMSFFRHCLHFFALHFLHFLHFQDVSLFRIMLVFSRLCLIVQIVQIVQCHFFMHQPILEPSGAPANFNLWGERRQCIFLVILNHYRGYLLRIPYPLPIYSLSSPSNGKVGNANRSKSDSNKRSWMTRYFSNSVSANACACS